MVVDGLPGTLLIEPGSADVLTTAMWFLFALIVLVVFRKPVAGLIRQVEEIRFRDLAIQTDAVDEIASTGVDEEEGDDYDALAELAPGYAVREGWAVLEGALGDLPAGEGRRTFRSRVRALEDAGVVGEREREAFDALRSVVAQVKDDASAAKLDPTEAARLARCGVGLSRRLSDLDSGEVQAVLGD